jgi:ankyrin repeat protein
MSASDDELRQAMEAVREKDLGKLKGLLSAKRIEVNQPCEGKYLLVEAVQAGTAFVEALLDTGAEPGVQDKRDSTPLVKAAWLGSVPTLKILLEAGADPNQMPSAVTSPLGAAVKRRSPKNLEAVQTLIAAGASVNTVYHSKDGLATGTVLMRACAAGNLEAVTALLPAGADANVVVLFGTALTKAAESGYDEIVRVLLEAGADPSARVPDRPDRVPRLAGKSALEIAREKRHQSVIALLSAAGEPSATVKSQDCQAAWLRLEAALKKKDPDVLKTFEPGAAEEDLTTLEAAIGKQLPIEAKILFRIHNGQTEERASAFIAAGDQMDARFRLLSSKKRSPNGESGMISCQKASFGPA